MGTKRILLPLLLLFLGMLALVAGAALSPGEGMADIRFRDPERNLSLAPSYDAENDKYYLCLPAFLDPSTLELSCPRYTQVSFLSGDGTPLALSAIPPDQDLTMVVRRLWSREKRFTLRLMGCSIGRSIFIEARAGTMAQIQADQTREAKVSVLIADGTGHREYQGYSTISGRGNGTWEWPKKPYDLTFPENVTVGPFTGVDRLSLLAEYVDTTKLRNALAYHMGSELGLPYHSEYEFADLFINGQYQGIYGITTKREYKKHTVSDGIEAVFELSTSYKGNYFYTDTGKQIRIHHGAQQQILYYVETLEDALMRRDWDSLWQIADLDTWARKYVLDEFLYNYDLSLTSQYYYVGNGGKICTMLPWDYEWIFYARMSPFDPADERALCAYWNTGNWYEILLEDESFRQRICQILETDYTDTFFTQLEQYLNASASQIAGSWICDRFLWDGSYAARYASQPPQHPLEENIALFRRCFDSRREFLLDTFRNWDDQCLITFFMDVDGTQTPAKLQLILPKGSDLTPYHQRIVQSLEIPTNCEHLGWFTPDGIPLEQITAVTADLRLISMNRTTTQKEN